MTSNSALAVFKALAEAKVRFLLAGGLAVNVYGYLRLTMDIDLVVQLIPQNIDRAFEALASLGYRPTVPVTAVQFADPTAREAWIRDKGMRVLRFYSDLHRETAVDLFVSEPFSFDEEYDRATIRHDSGIGELRVVSLAALKRMKQEAGRPQDLADLDNLRLRAED
jgi:hypothetical protein